MVVNENVIEQNLILNRKSQGYHYFSNMAALTSSARTIRYPNFLSGYSEKVARGNAFRAKRAGREKGKGKVSVLL